MELLSYQYLFVPFFKFKFGFLYADIFFFDIGWRKSDPGTLARGTPPPPAFELKLTP